MTLEEMRAGGHEQVRYFRDEATGLEAIVAINDTRLGPAVGGTRLWDYEDEAAALDDALRLSRAMAYKCAAAGLDYGGGKGVILAAPAEKTDDLLRAYGECIDTFGGSFVTGEDVNVDVADLRVVGETTDYVGGSEEHGIDATATGVRHGITACLAATRDSPSLDGVSVVVQGAGKVGSTLVGQLAARGAEVTVADIDDDRVDRLVADHGVRAVDPEAVYAQPCDVFAPCALGGVLDDETIPQLDCEVVCGSANNQLAERRHADALAERDVLYAPDYVVNAGALIAGTVEAEGGTTESAYEAVAAIGDRLRDLLATAREEGITPVEAADRYAEERMRAAE
ncbi:MAG: Glu/Leu/Phe/Val dehydrogenase dimerization domain-containing protein [Haloarculaceae archaeon]